MPYQKFVTLRVPAQNVADWKKKHPKPHTRRTKRGIVEVGRFKTFEELSTKERELLFDIWREQMNLRRRNRQRVMNIDTFYDGLVKRKSPLAFERDEKIERNIRVEARAKELEEVMPKTQARAEAEWEETRLHINQIQKTKPLRGVSVVMAQKINYGGEVWTRGDVAKQLQNEGAPQKKIDIFAFSGKTLTEEEAKRLYPKGTFPIGVRG